MNDEFKLKALSLIQSQEDPLQIAREISALAHVEKCELSSSMASLIENFPNYRKPIIEGLLRVGEVCNIISAPKIGKSWLITSLALSLVNGRKWLGRICERCNVLIVDAELHAETLSCRTRSVSRSTGLSTEGLHVLVRRGKNNDLRAIADQIIQEAIRINAMVIMLDALYRFWPLGMSENDNAAVTQIYNVLDGIARSANAAIVVVHHSSKGGQSDKSVTDGGSGAGAISRAADTHMFLRPHSEDGLVVMDAVARSWPPPEPIVIELDNETGIWSLVEGKDPSQLAGMEAPAQPVLDAAGALSLLDGSPLSFDGVLALARERGLKTSEKALKGLLRLNESKGLCFSGKSQFGGFLWSTDPIEQQDDKASLVIALKSKNPSWSAQAIAAEAGCSRQYVSRVLQATKQHE